MTVCSSAQRKKRRDSSKIKFKSVADHSEFISRITKTLYYGKIPLTERFSLPVTELAAELYSEVKSGRSLDRLHIDDAAEISRNACVSPCSLVLALLYLERLKTLNAEYVDKVVPSELFLVSMMVASKFLHDDGEEDEVFNNEWAASAGLDVKVINQLEWEFLTAINWEVFVSEEDFWTRLQSIEKTLAMREGKRRGWFSYSELSRLMESIEMMSVAQTLIVVSAVCVTSYTASVMAMVGSAIIVNHISSATNLMLYTTPQIISCVTSSLTTVNAALNCQQRNAIVSDKIISAVEFSTLNNETLPDYCENGPEKLKKLDFLYWNKLFQEFNITYLVNEGIFTWKNGNTEHESVDERHNSISVIEGMIQPVPTVRFCLEVTSH